MQKNIVLTGFMGTGKTTVGRILAKRLQRPFVDTDALIVQQQGRSIAAIFAAEGEAYFRQQEAAVAQALAQETGFIIATGGRLMLDEANATALSHNAHVFCLTATPATILTRVLAQADKRPLLNVPNPEARIQALLTQRAAAYGRFPQITTTNKTPKTIAEEIITCISAT